MKRFIRISLDHGLAVLEHSNFHDREFSVARVSDLKRSGLTVIPLDTKESSMNHEVVITLEAKIPERQFPLRAELVIATLPLRAGALPVERDRARAERAHYLGIQLDAAYQKFRKQALAMVKGEDPRT